MKCFIRMYSTKERISSAYFAFFFLSRKSLCDSMKNEEVFNLSGKYFYSNALFFSQKKAIRMEGLILIFVISYCYLANFT